MEAIECLKLVNKCFGSELFYPKAEADAEIAAMREKLARLVEVEKKYNELLFSVGKKYPNESRHDTALRYIRESDFGTIADAKEGGKSKCL